VGLFLGMFLDNQLTCAKIEKSFCLLFFSVNMIGGQLHVHKNKGLLEPFLSVPKLTLESQNEEQLLLFFFQLPFLFLIFAEK